MNDDEYSDDLQWHALNYRTAAIQHAEEMWKELLACVDRKVAAERERCAMEVWYAMKEATAEDADDMGLEGWMREAERRIWSA